MFFLLTILKTFLFQNHRQKPLERFRKADKHMMIWLLIEKMWKKWWFSFHWCDFWHCQIRLFKRKKRILLQKIASHCIFGSFANDWALIKDTSINSLVLPQDTKTAFRHWTDIIKLQLFISENITSKTLWEEDSLAGRENFRLRPSLFPRKNLKGEIGKLRSF